MPQVQKSFAPSFLTVVLKPQTRLSLAGKNRLVLLHVANVSGYRVMMGTTPDFTTATELTTVTKTEYIYTNVTGVTQTLYFFIVPMGTQGNGVISAGINVIVPTLAI